jgi:hypothetical protein
MASEKQIAANRRNATKSTGPRSAAGRKRAGRNAYQHGLNVNPIPSPVVSKQLEERAREIAGKSQRDVVILGLARAVAEAELDVDRARRTKVSLIQCVSAFGSLDPRQRTTRGIIRWLRRFERGDDPPLRLALSAAPAAMPAREPHRSTETMRRSLPQLWRLDRYEDVPKPWPSILRGSARCAEHLRITISDGHL